MTVQELIERLRTLPPDARIDAGEGTGGGGEVWAWVGRDYVPIWSSEDDA